MVKRKTDSGRGATEAGNGLAARSESRAATEEALLLAALRLLDRDGVLAGLNMKEVADEAGVNRGLIHRYFGGRRDLFRAALDRGAEEALPLHERARPNAPMKRAVDQFRGSLDISDWTRLITLLALDGDDSFDAMPFGENRIADMQREQAAGLFSEDVDVPVALLEWDASLLGYSILRRAASRQLGIPLDELDDRMLAVLRRYAEGKPRASEARGRRATR